MKPYNQMTDEEYAQWGIEENKRRAVEMANVDSAEALKQVQAACAVRREAVKMTAGQAAKAVIVAQRLERGGSLSWALR